MDSSFERGRYDQAIAAGERNRDTVTLIQNWCGHARIQKHGGVGLIEQSTGLPIGHHAMACDFAPAAGMACWELADAALHFYDANCSTCGKRQPVRLPNLSDLVAKRDRAQAEMAEARARAEQEVEAARLQRKTERDALRARCSLAQLSFIEDLEELDSSRSDAVATRIIEQGRLAPEIFEPWLVDFLYGLIAAREGWFVETGLELLKGLGTDRLRLAATALECLARHVAVRTAAEIAEEHAHDMPEQGVKEAIPALCYLAAESDFFSHSRALEIMPGPLLAVYRRFPAVVNRAIQELLDDRRPHAVSTGAAGVLALGASDPAVAVTHLRSLATKLARAHLLLDADETFREDSLFNKLQRAIGLAFAFAPGETDGVLQTFMEGAPIEGEARLARVYERFVSRSETGHGGVQSEALPVAIARLLRIATSSTHGELLQEVADAFRHPSEALQAATKGMIDPILGAAALMDTQLVDLRESTAATPSRNVLEEMERQNERGRLNNIKVALCRLAAEASADDSIATEAYVGFLDRVDSAHEGLRSTLVEHLHILMRTPSGLNAALPALYSAMFGSSTVTRGAAANTLGELRGRRADDLPGLVFEAFLAMLTDRYVYVHRSAVDALSHLRVPDRYSKAVATAIETLISAYRTDSDAHAHRFMLKCIMLWASKFMSDSKRDQQIARILVAVMSQADPAAVAEELRFSGDSFAEVPGYVELLIKLLSSRDAMRLHQEGMLRLLRFLPVQSINAQREGLKAAGEAWLDDLETVAAILETLTRAAAWPEAVELAEAFHDSIPSTIREQHRKWHAYQLLSAVRFEAALAVNDDVVRNSSGDDWRRTKQQIESDLKEHAARRDPLRGLPFSLSRR